MAVTETIEDIIAVDVSSADWENGDHRTFKRGLIFCTAAGDVAVEMKNGTQTSKTMEVGEYWRISPFKILNTGTTATVEFHL